MEKMQKCTLCKKELFIVGGIGKMKQTGEMVLQPDGSEKFTQTGEREIQLAQCIECKVVYLV